MSTSETETPNTPVAMTCEPLPELTGAYHKQRGAYLVRPWFFGQLDRVYAALIAMQMAPDAALTSAEIEIGLGLVEQVRAEYRALINSWVWVEVCGYSTVLDKYSAPPVAHRVMGDPIDVKHFICTARLLTDAIEKAKRQTARWDEAYAASMRPEVQAELAQKCQLPELEANNELQRAEAIRVRTQALLMGAKPENVRSVTTAWDVINRWGFRR